MKKPRRFKCRNGVVVEEITRTDTVTINGYQDDYKVVDWGTNPWSEAYSEWICLSLEIDGFPRGNHHGPGFDIVEEIEDYEP